MDNIYTIYDRNLYKIGVSTYSFELPANQVSANGVSGVSDISGVSINQQQQYVGALLAGKTKFTNDESGYILGIDQGVPKFYIGNSLNYLNWDGTQLLIFGNITATTGTIGGFVIGADYIRDIGDSFGLASTVTGTDDVRFWAGTDYDHRYSAPFRVTEGGVVTGADIVINGGTIGGGVALAAGNTDEVQFNKGGRQLGASPCFRWDDVNKLLILRG
jgi:hypothetical protein